MKFFRMYYFEVHEIPINNIIWNSYKYSYNYVILTIRLIWATHICDLTTSRVTVDLMMIQRLVKWFLNLFPLFLFLSSLLLLLALILSSILGSLTLLFLFLSLSLYVHRIFSLSISLKYLSHEQRKIQYYKWRCPLI